MENQLNYLNSNTNENFSTTYDKESNVIRISREYTKDEPEYDYKEVSGEWYEYNENSDFSCGHKYYSNSKKRTYYENWWKTSRGEINEIKIESDLDDGLGTKTHETFGFKEVNGTKIYEFKDTTITNVVSEEVRTYKTGIDINNKWNSFNIKTSSINHVENYGKNSENNDEWFEKWYESSDQKYAYKWAKNQNKEWEEEWKEMLFRIDYNEKHCFKKCRLFNENSHWFETWTEKYCYKENLVHKSCYKIEENLDLNIKNENKWSDSVPITA